MITRIDHGQVWAGGRLQPLSILIQDEKIAGLLAPTEAVSIAVDQVIDGSGCWILPGGIDLHVHIMDGAETFHPGSCCASAGGITTVLDMAPFHACVTPQQLRAKVEAGQAACVVDFGLVAGIAVDESDLQHLAGLAAEGAAYFKVFMPSEPPVSAATLWRAVQAAAQSGLRLGLHAEETACFSDWEDNANPLGFARSRPIVAEASAVAQVLEMARAAGAPVHICHVSADRTVDIIATARAQGVDVTAEVTAHNLLLDESAYSQYGPRAKTTPPLRTQADARVLWQALAEGIIDALACDHYLETLQPQPTDAAGITAGAAGIGGLELSLPLLFSAGVVQGRLSLGRFAAATAERPAEIAGLQSKGRIIPGADADLTFWSPAETWQASGQGFFSRIETTPFHRWNITGRVARTIVRGRTVWDGEHIIAEAGWGRWNPSRRDERND